MWKPRQIPPWRSVGLSLKLISWPVITSTSNRHDIGRVETRLVLLGSCGGREPLASSSGPVDYRLARVSYYSTQAGLLPRPHFCQHKHIVHDQYLGRRSCLSPACQQCEAFHLHPQGFRGRRMPRRLPHIRHQKEHNQASNGAQSDPPLPLAGWPAIPLTALASPCLILCWTVGGAIFLCLCFQPQTISMMTRLSFVGLGGPGTRSLGYLPCD